MDLQFVEIGNHGVISIEIQTNSRYKMWGVGNEFKMLRR